MLFDYHFRNYNLRLLLYTTFLSIIGIMAIRSASIQDPSVAIKQIIGVVISITICVVISMIDYHWFNRFSWVIYGVCIAFLVLVLIRGRSTNGATRWLKVLWPGIFPGLSRCSTVPPPSRVLHFWREFRWCWFTCSRTCPQPSS